MLQRAPRPRGAQGSWLAPGLKAALGLRAALALAGAPFATASELSFERFDLDLAAPHEHVVIPGRFLGGEIDDIAVIAVSKDNERTVSIYSLAGAGDANADARSWRQARKHDLDADVIFVESLRLADDSERLLLGRRGALALFDADSGREQPLFSLPSIYNVAPVGELPRLDIARDIDGDELDDIVLADFDGYSVVRQRRDGSWSAPAKVAVSAGVSLSGGLAWSYRPRAVHPIDYDGDGTKDLAFWDRGELRVHPATADGYAAALTVDLDSFELDSDENALETAFGGDEDEEARTLWGMDDYNGDGIPDIAVQRVRSDSLLSQEIDYALHFGRRADGATTFSPEADALFASDGLQMMEAEDLNGDGVQELMVATLHISIGRIIAALLTGRFAFDLDTYVPVDGVYPQEPSLSQRVKVKFSLLDGTASMPSMEFADLDGDGIEDRVVATPGDGMVVHRGVPGPTLLARDAREFESPFPDDDSSAIVVVRDFDRDDRGDLLFSADQDDGRLRMALLLSR